MPSNTYYRLWIFPLIAVLEHISFPWLLVRPIALPIHYFIYYENQKNLNHCDTNDQVIDESTTPNTALDIVWSILHIETT